MGTKTPWTLLRGGSAEQKQGLHRLQSAHARACNGSTIMELGVAHLWLYQYRQAWGHFHEAIEEFPIKGDGFYGMAGVAKWCLDEPVQAVAEWSAGLTAKYARASGLGVIMPLLLFFASVVRPDVFEIGQAKKLILEKVTNPRIKNWPGPIAKLVLGQISEDEFQTHCRGTNQQNTRDRQWLAEFYRNLTGAHHGTASTLKESMRMLADTSQPEWRDEALLLRRIWNEEFFLARHEAI